jgi:phage host-nuclease inhibitor protein Gam
MPIKKNIELEADSILARMRKISVEQNLIANHIENKIAIIKKGFGPRLDELRQSFEALEKDIKSLMMKHKRELFAGTDDRVQLEHGALLYKLETVILHNRDMLKKIKAAGLTDAIIIAESVNWDVVATWPDETLWSLGSDRREKERFEFEVQA